MFYHITDINGISNAVYNYIKNEIARCGVNNADIRDLHYLENQVDCDEIAEKIIKDDDFQDKLGEFIHEYLYKECE